MGARVDGDGSFRVGPLVPGDYSVRASYPGTLDYSVDGVAVHKSIVRQFITFDDFRGVYLGAIHQEVTGCANASRNGASEDFATLTMTQGPGSLGFSFSSQLGFACSFSGTLAQAGRFGGANGTATCTGQPPSAAAEEGVPRTGAWGVTGARPGLPLAR